MRISDWSSDVCSSDLQVAHRGRRGSRAAGVAELLAFGHVLVQVMLDIEPRTLVLRFVLHPDDFGRLAVLAQFGFERLVGKRVQLLDADDGRSEEHTSELQSLMRISYAVFCLTKKNIQNHT